MRYCHRLPTGSMTIPESLLEILCCPVSHEALRPLEPSRLKKLNQSIESGALLYVDGSAVEEPLTDALITRNGKVIYVHDPAAGLLKAARTCPAATRGDSIRAPRR
jgi:uncharacterized protein YbaR (Trm112 family)